MRGLLDKGVLISGGTSGIGLASAERFIEEGARVFVAGLKRGEVDAAVAMLAQRGRAGGLACDVSSSKDVAKLVEAAEEALGGIDVLINNAGTARRDPFLDIAAADWDRILAVNLRGMFLVAQAASVGDRHRSAADRREIVYVHGAPGAAERHLPTVSCRLPARAPARERVRQRPARGSYGLGAGILPGEPSALQFSGWFR